MCNTLINVADTTAIESTRERRIAKAKRMCDRVHAWIARDPSLHSMRPRLADLIGRLPPNTSHHNSERPYRIEVAGTSLVIQCEGLEIARREAHSLANRVKVDVCVYHESRLVETIKPLQ